jgi:hypothetical protein
MSVTSTNLPGNVPGGLAVDDELPGGGSDTTLQADLFSGAPQVTIPAGETVALTTGGLVIPPGVELVINGTLDGSAAPPTATLLTATGTVAAAQALLANCLVGQSYAQVAGLTPADGTYVKLQSNALWNAGLTLNFPSSGNQRYGEFLLVRVPSATVGAAGITAGATTVVLNNTQGDARTSYFPVGAPVTIDGDSITFTGVSVGATSITLTGCSGVNNNHLAGAPVALAAGYVAFAGPCVGGPYNVSDGAAIVPTTFCDEPAVTGTGTILGAGSAGGAQGQWGIIFNTCRNLRVGAALRFLNLADTAIYLLDCIDVNTDGPIVRGGRSVSSDFYGWLIAGGQDVTIKGGHYRDVRHSVSGGNTPVYGIARRVTVDGAHAVLTTATSFESHGGTDDWSYVNCHSTDAVDNGLSLRCPSGRVENFICRRPADRGIWLRNQTTQPSRYVVTGFDIEDSAQNGIALRPDTGFFANLQSTIAAGTAPPFTLTVDSTSQPNGFPTTGGTIIVGETSGTGAEQMVYDTCTATTFHVTARAQNGTTAQTFTSGPIMLGSTGTGATTDSVEISNGKILRTVGDCSLSVYTADNLRFQGVKIANVTIKDQVYGGAAVQLTNVDHCDIDVTVLGHPATRKMVQLINCTHVRVRLNGKYAAQSTGVAISFESGCFKCEAIMPTVENAGTGVLADATCSNCTATTGNGLKGATTRVSFPTGKGHYWNQSPKQIIAPNIPIAGPAPDTIIAGTVYIGRLEIDQPQIFQGKANVFVTQASSSATDTLEVAILDELLDAAPIHTTGAVAGVLNSTGHKTLSFADTGWELERGTYWVAVYAPVTTSAVQLECAAVGPSSAGSPWSLGGQTGQRALIGNVYGGGAGSTISGMPAIGSGTAGSSFCPMVAVE